MSSSGASSWIDVIPSVSLSSQGHTLGYYTNVARYIIIVPLLLLVLVAVGYNVAVALATRWMYRHAWKNAADTNKNIVPKSLIWEEIYTVNMKLANYLLGDGVVLKEDGNHLLLQIHDYSVYMPLAMILIQVSQFAVAMVLTVLFFDFLVLQVSHVCNPYHSGVDCFSATETSLSATPLPCNDTEELESLNITNVTCFQVVLNPVIAASVTGGFLKFAPHVIFSWFTYQYIKFLKVTKYFRGTKKCSLMCHIICAVCMEVVLLVGGVVVLVIVLKVPAIRDITFTANPVRQMTIVFCFIGYFMAAASLWSLIPLDKIPNRFGNLFYRQFLSRSNNGLEDTGVAIRGSSEKLRPWVVVDQSLATDEYNLLSDD